jgi:hypothetical protein
MEGEDSMSLIPGGFGVPIQGKTGFGISGALAGGFGGYAAGGCQVAIAAAIAIGLVGVIGGSFFDGDYENSAYCTTPQQERTWVAVGYTILFGLAVTLFGILLTFFVPDWRPLLIASIGMLFVVIALSYGGSLEHHNLEHHKR